MNSDSLNRPTDGARMCLKSMLDKIQESIKCCGHIEESPDWLCSFCRMHYFIDDDYWDGESTGCYIKDMVKHLDWIDNDVYLK